MIHQLNKMLLNVVFAFFINMVFNVVMDAKNQIQADKELIETLGGPTRVCELLGFDKAKGGVQRVQNWTTRGIPPKEKLAHPRLFLQGYARRATDAAPSAGHPGKPSATSTAPAGAAAIPTGEIHGR